MAAGPASCSSRAQVAMPCAGVAVPAIASIRVVMVSKLTGVRFGADEEQASCERLVLSHGKEVAPMSATRSTTCATFIRRFVVLDDQQADAVTLVGGAYARIRRLRLHAVSRDHVSREAERQDTAPRSARAARSRAVADGEHLGRRAVPRHRRAASRRCSSTRSTRSSGRSRASARSCAGSSTPATAAARPRTAWAARTTRRLQTFSVYCPKAFAGIGDCLPDTIADRAIPIRLKRRTRDEAVERFRLRDVEPKG